MNGALLPINVGQGLARSRKQHVSHDVTTRMWSDEMQLQFLTDWYNQVPNAFSEPAVDRTVIGRVVESAN